MLHGLIYILLEINMGEKINYVITTWSGPRRAPNLSYLKNHLLKLLSLKHDLAQITIVKPITNSFNPIYYQIDSLLSEFKCDIKILEKHDNLGQSYGQFFYAFQTYGDKFDYYIFVEDDYIPDIDNFDSLLLNEYKSQDVKGFLCSYSGEHPEYPKGACSVSNGMISTEFFKKIYTFFSNPINEVNNNEGHMCHYNFVKLLRDCDYEFKDFSHKFRVPYYGDNKIIEYGRTDVKESIFSPYQLLNLNFKFRKMESTDISIFLEIRNVSKEFLHNNSEFTLDDANNWFNTYNPNFYMIELGENIIGYFRTSNWENKSMYLGCDLAPNYRGFGLGYTSYIGFINKLKNEFDLDNIKLEVLSTNIRAKNLYDKLGFKTIGVSSEKIVRNDEEIDSIIMELKL